MIRNILCILTIGLMTPVMFPFAVTTLLVTRSADASMWWTQRPWSWLMMFASGASIEVVGGQQYIDPKRPVIFLSNHMSTLDIPVLFRALWPVRFRFVIKNIIKYVPFLGWYTWLAGFVFVDRSRTRKAIASLDAAATKIRKGTSIVIFAEGTRSENGKVLPFKKGPFMLALKAGVPVLPVTIVGTDIVMPKNSWNITPTTVKVKIGAPIDPAQFNGDRDALMRAVRDVIIDQSLELGGKGGDKRTVLSRVKDGEKEPETGDSEEAEA
ncbi:MAG: lysophospholipid acyltransferase family protein [Myxococcaceae bacterium]